MTMLMMLSRRVRRVPLDYQTPQRDDGRGVQPRFDEFYVPAVKDWLARRERWVSGEDPDAARHPDLTFEEWDGNGPDPDYYHPGEAWPDDAELGIQMYEEVTEGTPISAVYPDTQDGRHAMAAELGASERGITSNMTAEDWLRIIDGQALAKNIHTDEIVGLGDG